MDPGSRQGSRTRILRPTTSPSLPSLGPLTVSPADFLRSFNKINNYVSLAQRAVQLDQLKRARIQSIAEEKYVKAIKHLENAATQPRFLSEYVALQPWKVTMGFLEAGQLQYFMVSLKGNTSPLNAVIQKSRGVVESYFSYKSLKPGPDIYDFRFRGSSFKVEGKFTTFREVSACIGVRAISDCTFAIMITFGEEPPAAPEEDQKQQITAMNQTLPGTFALDALEDLFEDISTAPSLSLVNHVQLNKQILPNMRDFTLEKAHRRLVKSRQIENYQQRKERIREQAERNVRRLEAQRQGKYISSVLQRKAKFEKTWLGLIYFARASFEAYRRFELDKGKSIEDTKVFLACFRMQKSYRKAHNEDFPINLRRILLARNHLRLFLMVKNHHFGEIIQHKLINVIKASKFVTIIGLKIDQFCARITRIQRKWRLAKAIDRQYFRFLSRRWDLILGHFIAKQEENRKRKKTKKKISRYSYSILPESAKIRIIRQLFADAVAKLRSVQTPAKGIVARLCNFLPKMADMRQVVKIYARSEGQEAV